MTVFILNSFGAKNLTAFLDEIYRKRAKFCVVFISKEYKERRWTSHELRSAQARALEAKGDDYILPIRVDNTDLDGLPSNIGYLSIELGVGKIAELFDRKAEDLTCQPQRVGRNSAHDLHRSHAAS